MTVSPTARLKPAPRLWSRPLALTARTPPQLHCRPCQPGRSTTASRCPTWMRCSHPTPQHTPTLCWHHSSHLLHGRPSDPPCARCSACSAHHCPLTPLPTARCSLNKEPCDSSRHVYITTVPALCLPHTGFAGAWSPSAIHAELICHRTMQTKNSEHSKRWLGRTIRRRWRQGLRRRLRLRAAGSTY